MKKIKENDENQKETGFRPVEKKIEPEYDRIMNLKKVTKNQKTGIVLEEATSIALDILEIPHQHNPFNSSYAQTEGQGIDFKVPTEKGIIGIECKNLNGTHQLSPDWMNEEVNHRDKDSSYISRILIISILNVGEELLKTLEGSHHLIILGFQITSYETFLKSMEILVSKLCWIKMKYFFSKSSHN